jgi:peptidyl-prolyl cis-trans isomerase SurA
LVLGCALLVACRKAPPDNVAASVNDRPITYEQLDKQYQFSGLIDSERISPDERANRRMEVLRSMIDYEIMLQRAEKLGLMAVDSDVDAALAERRAPYTQEEFQRELDQRNMTEEDLRTQLRRDLSVQKLLNREITAHITITDQDVTDFYEANKSEFNFPEPQLRLAQIVVTPGADLNVTNLRQDSAQTEEEAEEKIKIIEARLKRGEDFAMVARNYSEDPNSAPNGGDMGFINESALTQAPVELRSAVLGLQPGQISGIIEASDGSYRIIRLLSREPAGQRQLDDPRVQQTIRDQLRNRKDQLLKNAYYEVARNEARVVNYYALDITEAKGPPE